jgi:hypothetical protein
MASSRAGSRRQGTFREEMRRTGEGGRRRRPGEALGAGRADQRVSVILEMREIRF